MKEMTIWRNLLRENNIGTLNEATSKGYGKYLICLAETLHEHRYGDIANQIAAHPDTKLVLIAGPSSSGNNFFQASGTAYEGQWPEPHRY